MSFRFNPSTAKVNYGRCCFQAPFNTVTYQLIGDDITPTFFSVDSSTGLISLRQGADLRTDTQSKYTVSYPALWGE